MNQTFHVPNSMFSACHDGWKGPEILNEGSMSFSHTGFGWNFGRVANNLAIRSAISDTASTTEPFLQPFTSVQLRPACFLGLVLTFPTVLNSQSFSHLLFHCHLVI